MLSAPAKIHNHRRLKTILGAVSRMGTYMGVDHRVTYLRFRGMGQSEFPAHSIY